MADATKLERRVFVAALMKTTNLTPWGLEKSKLYMDRAPERERRPCAIRFAPWLGLSKWPWFRRSSFLRLTKLQ